MIQWFESLSAIQRFFAYIAIPSTLILAIQTILLIFGLAGGGDGDADSDGLELEPGGGVDLDGDGEIDIPGEDFSADDLSSAADGGLRLFTIRGFIAFFTVFGWGGLALLREIGRASCRERVWQLV